MFERLRIRLANLLLPEFRIIIKLKGGHQHVQKLNRVSRAVFIEVPSLRDDSPSLRALDEATVADSPGEREDRRALGYRGMEYAGMEGEDTAYRDKTFKDANTLRGAQPVDPDVIARLRKNLQDEGKLPE
ncbi:hypothetical protein BMS3Bbin02_00101 [bacterium BMS3Bbin02]|nr:hypothetical protein BMS3Bbin02_00101 [bacterium BMS3Bbin02]